MPSSPGPNSTTDDRCEILCNRLASRIGRNRYGMWFDHTAQLRIENDHLNVAAESQFVADWIRRHFRRDLEALARETIGENASVRLHVTPEVFASHPGRNVESPSSASTSTPEPHPNNLRGPGAAVRPSGSSRGPRGRRQRLRRLENFVVGNSNRLAYQAACTFSRDPDNAPQVLFIHGECGLGKTHLLQSVIEDRRSNAPSEILRYVTGEEFTNEYIAAVRSGKLEPFRRSMRRLDVLAIDDIHFLSNKTATQNEFLYTLDAIGLGGANILLASDEHPRDIGRFSASLTSRLLGGMVVRIDRPERAMRGELVRRLADDNGVDLADAAIEILAERFSGSVRELSGAIMKLKALRGLDTARTDAVGAIMVMQMLEGELTPRPRTPVRIPRIIEAVCRRLVIESDELLGRGRHQRVVLARGLVVHLARAMTTMSFPEIARGLGRENHSTVHTAARRIESQLTSGNTPNIAELDGVSLADLIEQLKHDVIRESARR